MYCGKCGSQISDDVAFCPKCGTKINNDGNVASHVETQQEASFGGINASKDKPVRKKALFIGGIIVAIIIVIICISNISIYKTIDLNKYISISTDGYDGYGTARYELNAEELSKDFVSKYKLKESDSDLQNTIMGISNGLGITDYACSGAFLTLLGSVELSEDEYLSNGDELILSWKTLDSENGDSVKQRIKDSFSIKLDYSDIKYKVSDLKPVEKVEPFEGVDIKFYGLEESSNISVKANPDNGIIYSVENNGPYHNGDKVIVKSLPLGYSSWYDYTMNSGKATDNETAEFVIDGLDTLVTKLEQIPSKNHDELIKSANTIVTLYVNEMIKKEDWDGKDKYDGKVSFTYSEPILCKEYLVSSLSSGTSELYMLYRMDYHVKYDWGGSPTWIGEASFPVYTGVLFNDKQMKINSDGERTNSDVTGTIVENKKDYRFEFRVHDEKGRDKGRKYCLFKKAFSLEDFEKDIIDSRTDDKDIKIYSEYDISNE